MNRQNHFIREDYWKNFALPSERRFFDAQYAKSFILDSADHTHLKNVAKNVLYQAMHPECPQTDFSFEQVLVEINQTKSLAVKKDLETFHQLEKWLVGVLEKNGLLQGIEGIEFPLNLRAVHGHAPEGYLQREYATDYYHTDIWSGEPSDIIIGFIYVEGDVTKTFMEVFDVDPKDVNLFEKKLDKYTSLNSQTAQAQQIHYLPQKGQMILMDGVCPHRTVRSGGGARISLDFRLRRVNPYADLAGWGKSHAPWSRYWFLDKKRPQSFAERADQELHFLKQNGPTKGLELRKKWLEEQVQS